MTPLLAIGRDWWLPPNYAVHGRATDSLFSWFFWITMAVFVAVELTLVLFVWKFRAGASNPRAKFLHGSKRLEVIWTLIPAAVLAVLALASKRVWEDWRESPDLVDPNRTSILIIGERFKWNVVYPGPDGKFGQYLQFPKVTDKAWPVGPDGTATSFAGVPGPASVPADDAAKLIGDYIDQVNPLGKVFSDPDGADDDWVKFPGRKIYVPVDRPVEILLQSKDVIHDFFLPNFRAQLYAVPGMTGRFVFTPTITTAELERPTIQFVPIDDLVKQGPMDRVIDIDAGSPGAVQDKTGWRYADNTSKKKIKESIIRDGAGLSDASIAKLKAAGITAVKVHVPMPFEIACAQLCGAQHYTMRGELVVLSQAEFDRKFPAGTHAGSK